MNYQRTLGELMHVLENRPKDSLVPNLKNPHSYQGYYTDLAFEQGEGAIRCDELLELCRQTLGRSFTGYKGGAFEMGVSTPVWIANKGSTGEMLVGISYNGSIWTEDDDSY